MQRREFLRLVGLSFAAGVAAQAAGELMTSASASSVEVKAAGTNFADLYRELMQKAVEHNTRILEQTLFDPLTFALKMDYAKVSPMERAVGVHEDPRYKWHSHGLSIVHQKDVLDEEM